MAAGMKSPIEVTYLGHSAVRLRGSRTIFIDPFLTGNPSAALAADAITSADIIAVTHDHSDHLGDAFDISKRTGADIVAINELANDAKAVGLNAVGFNIGGTVEVRGVKFHMVSALHSAGKGAPAGLVLEMDGRRIYHAGDTGLTYDMRLVGEFFAPDLAFLPIGDWFTMGPISAAKSVELIRPKKVIPVHYGTFPILSGDPKVFKAKVGAAAEVIILKPGEKIHL
jgi:L-ascorbate metabolism protein UlaG (beta-lactamase superfamily)